MKNPINFFYGIYNVFIWVKQWTVMFISGFEAEDEMCLVTRNGQYENG
jgi:hypothetical protein